MDFGLRAPKRIVWVALAAVLAALATAASAGALSVSGHSRAPAASRPRSQSAQTRSQPAQTRSQPAQTRPKPVRSTALAPTDLTVDDQSAPLSASTQPQFGWDPQDRAGDEVQSAYDLTVRSARTGATVWNSGKVRVATSQAVAYAGPALRAGDAYTWTVQTWNRQGQSSPTASASFNVAIGDSDWSGAQWIRRPTTGNDTTVDYTLARRQVTLTDTRSPITRALVYIAAPMRWQLHVNGQVIDTQDDYQTAGENLYDVEDITSEARAAATSRGANAKQLAVGILDGDYADGEAHPEGPQPYATTLSADAAAGSSTISVATQSTASTCASAPTTSAAFCGASDDWYVGETLGFGAPSPTGFFTDTISAISDNTVTLTHPLAGTELAGTPVTSENGPSGMLAKIVIEHANGTTQTVVSNSSWRVTKDTAEANATVTERSGQDTGDYVEYYDAQAAQTLAGWDRAGYRTGAAWQPAVDMGTAPLPNPPDCGDYTAVQGKNVAPSAPATGTADPILSSPCGFTHLAAQAAPVTYKVIHPKSVITLPDGTAVADFGAAFVGVPVVRFPDATSAQAGNQVTLQSSYRLGGTVTTAAAPAGATSITVNTTSAYPDFAGTGPGLGFEVGDPITVDAPADGYGAGHPQTDTITSINGDVIGLSTPLSAAHATNVWVQDARVGTSVLDTQDTNLSWHYTQSGTPGETTGFYVPMGWRYVQITGAGTANGGHPLSAQDVWAVEQYNASSQVGSRASDPGEHNGGAGAPDTAANASGYTDSATRWDPASVFSSGPGSAVDEAARFTSSNPELNRVFSLIERSAQFAGQQSYEDSPDRQEGSFTGDGTNESLAEMEDLGERGLTKQFIDNLISSQKRWWIAGAPAPGSTWGEVNAIYPDSNLSNGGKRDIPDYTEMFPELVWDYYMASGDLATLKAAYPTMENIATYLDDNTYVTGQTADLVCQLASFSTSKSYEFGIIDWPQDDRYNTVVLNSGVDSVINDRAVLDYGVLGDAAGALGLTRQAASYAAHATTLRNAINSTLKESDGLYGDGFAVAGSAQNVPGNCAAASGGSLITNTSQISQSFAVVDGVAPSSDDATLGSFIASQGMKAGPMDIGQLEQSLVDTGQSAGLVKLLTNPDGDGYAKILAEGGTSLWENWDPGCSAASGAAGDNDTYDNEECSGAEIDQTSSNSFSHGWGSAGLYSMTRGLLGITPTGVGQSAVNVTPPSSGLGSAHGTEWTQHGAVSVKWKRAQAGSGSVDETVVIPDNMHATVSLPVGATVGYRASGGGAPTFLGRRDGRARYRIGSGVTRFIAQRH